MCNVYMLTHLPNLYIRRHFEHTIKLHKNHYEYIKNCEKEKDFFWNRCLDELFNQRKGKKLNVDKCISNQIQLQFQDARILGILTLLCVLRLAPTSQRSEDLTTEAQLLRDLIWRPGADTTTLREAWLLCRGMDCPVLFPAVRSNTRFQM